MSDDRENRLNRDWVLGLGVLKPYFFVLILRFLSGLLGLELGALHMDLVAKSHTNVRASVGQSIKYFVCKLCIYKCVSCRV